MKFLKLDKILYLAFLGLFIGSVYGSSSFDIDMPIKDCFSPRLQIMIETESTPDPKPLSPGYPRPLSRVWKSPKVCRCLFDEPSNICDTDCIANMVHQLCMDPFIRDMELVRDLVR